MLVLVGALACRRESVGPGAGVGGTNRAVLGDSVGGVFSPPVAIQGIVVDEVTGAAIAGATVIVLRPGVDPARWQLVYQSRSGRPEDPWLEPDICDHLETLHEQGVGNVIIHPVGFLSDHIEVLFDLDDEAAK